MFRNFIREAQVFLGESSERGNPDKATVISSSGKLNDLRVAFNVKKTMDGTPNQMQVVLYNLNQGTRAALSEKFKYIDLQAGYSAGQEQLRTIAIGSISSAIPERDGADIKTTVNALDGMEGISLATFHKSYNGEIALKNIVQDCAGTMANVKVQTIDIAGKTGQKGSVYAGKSSDILDKLGREWGFNWSVQNGVFKAIPDNVAENTVYIISFKNKNLVSALPMVDNVLQQVIGVRIRTLLDPRIEPNDKVKLESEVVPQLNSTYNVTNISHTGDTHSDNWFTDIECYKQIG